jgi:hypothetical protein
METNNEYKKQNRYKQTNNNKNRKGKTLVILTKEEYNHRIQNFIRATTS